MTRTALVTGANRGIGLAFAGQLLARGDHVVATCRYPGKAAALNALGGEHPGRLHVLPLDVANDKSRAELVRELPLVLGGEGRLDLLINNAGVLHSGERFGQLRQETLEDSLRINAIGPLLLAQALAPLLRDRDRPVDSSENVAGTGAAGAVNNQANQVERLDHGSGGARAADTTSSGLDLRSGIAGSGGGREALKSLPDTRLVDRPPAAAAASGCPVIANLSSQLGSIAGVTRFGAPSYAISKAAQNMASVLLARALAERGIVVLALHPGWVQTEMGGAGAQVAPVDAVAGLLWVIDAATPAQSGTFVDWRGDALPW